MCPVASLNQQQAVNYKELLHKTVLLISSPTRAWEEIVQEDRRRVAVNFVYPLIGLCALSVFIGCILSKGWSSPESFQYAMTQCCAVAISLFGGYYLAAYLINAVRVNIFGQDSSLLLSQQFVGYAMVVCLLLRVVLGVLPDVMLVALVLQFYTFYLVWEGSKVLMDIDDERRVRFTVISSVIILLCPVIIEQVFIKLMATFN